MCRPERAAVMARAVLEEETEGVAGGSRAAGAEDKEDHNADRNAEEAEETMRYPLHLRYRLPSRIQTGQRSCCRSLTYRAGLGNPREKTKTKM